METHNRGGRVIIISDPYGSWVTGAKEGLSSSIALRNAEDEAAQHAYALQRAHQFDPYNLQELQARARISSVDANNAEKFGTDMAAAALQQQQFKVPEAAAALGVPQAFMQQIQKMYPGIRFNTATGKLEFPVTDASGTHYINTNLSEVRPMQDAMAGLRAGNYYSLEEHRRQLEEEARQRELFKEQGGSTPSYHALPGLKPAATPPVPTGQFNMPRTTAVGPMTQGNQFSNVQAGSSTLPSSAGAYNLNAQTRYGPNVYSDIQNNPTVPGGTAVPYGKRNLYNLQY